jgi:hypothetical protein
LPELPKLVIAKNVFRAQFLAIFGCSGDFGNLATFSRTSPLAWLN